MAKELDEFPQTRGRRAGAASRYPLDEWFNGKVWQLDAGEDFDAKPENIRITLSKAAKARDGKLRTALVNDGKSVVIQFLKD